MKMRGPKSFKFEHATKGGLDKVHPQQEGSGQRIEASAAAAGRDAKQLNLKQQRFGAVALQLALGAKRGRLRLGLRAVDVHAAHGVALRRRDEGTALAALLHAHQRLLQPGDELTVRAKLEGDGADRHIPGLEADALNRPVCSTRQQQQHSMQSAEDVVNCRSC